MQDVRRVESLTFLFIPKVEDLCKHYDLERESTEQFIRKAKWIRFYMYFLMFGFEGFFITFILRCLVLSYLEIELLHFLYITVPFGLITFFGFHCLTFVILSFYTFLFTTMEFLAHRARTVSETLLKLSKYNDNHMKYMSIYGKQIVLRKKSQRAFQVIKTINSIIRQFKQSNRIFDNLVSLIYLEVLLCG